MRRIIERVVTVVTTTTWKISWEPDSPATQPTTDSDPDEHLQLERPPGPTVPETKEVDQHLKEETTNHSAASQAEVLKSYSLEKGIKNHEHKTY